MSDTAYFWFRLFRTKGIGPKRLVAIQRELERQRLDPEDVPLKRSLLEKQYPDLAKIIVDNIRAEDQEAIRREYELLKKENVSVIYPRHRHYPPTLIQDAARFGVSPVLLGKGQTQLLRELGVAIVGSRKVSERGVEAARQLAKQLAQKGFNVVSGYARGVDTGAHLGALEAKGTTTMVLSYGILKFKLKGDLGSLDDIYRSAVAISQFSPHELWRARNAMARNKLVCALSSAVVVIESGPEKDDKGKMSGTFAAAKEALKMGRRLFVVDPKYLDDPSAGNADLIRRGGISIDPDSGANEIAERLHKDEKNGAFARPASHDKSGQLELPLARNAAGP
ncbi:MAG: hypothetical protein KatS3mg042_0722 [Rhodothermaceae bacterium]|nr:MAG: hypothetical protein KatS3mg042_0722 [Rhodothermaceae bacterium]